MSIGVSDTPGPRMRARHEETPRVPLEAMLTAALAARANQDETSPFLLEFEIVASKGRRKREPRKEDETLPFLLEFEVLSPASIAGLEQAGLVPVGVEHTARRHGSTGQQGLPRLQWRGVDTSVELREYAARVASGEALPPYRGPILATGEFPRSVQEAPRAVDASDSKAFLKLALALMLLAAALVASAVLGDDAALRATGQSISRWFTGADPSLESFPMAAPEQPPLAAPSSR
jgi:hypothetical protein